MHNRPTPTGASSLEWAIALAIITILVAMALSFYLSALEDARADLCRVTRHFIEQSARYYHLDTNSTAWPSITRDLVPKFLDREPTCPTGGEYELDPFGKVTCTRHRH